MCQFTNQDNQKVAERDIIVYKVLVIRGNAAYTPYIYTLVPSEILNGQMPFKAIGKTKKRRLGGRYYWEINGGNIHTYANASDAWNYATYMPIIETFQTVVYECVIPKGTPYYYGCTYGHTPTYASKQIRFVKQIHKLQQSTQLNLFG